MSSEQIIYGKIILGPEPETIEGYICLKDGVITDIGEEKTSSDIIISPCLVNSHTHIGDSVLKDPVLGKTVGNRVERDLDSLVKPPDGLKHRTLQATSHSRLIESMKRTISDMITIGTSAFADFREGGVPGTLALKGALDGKDIMCRILGRISRTEGYKTDIEYEAELLLQESYGLGISGSRDMDRTILETLREVAASWKKPFFIHAGEKDRSDIDSALSLDPDVFIHMTHADQSDLRQVADEQIPVVVCPRSNFITGVGMSPVEKMLDLGINVAIGTDNVMFNSPNMFAEMEVLGKIFKIDDRQVFKMCTLNGASILNVNKGGYIAKGLSPKIMILNASSDNLTGITDPVRGIVRRARPDDILTIIN
ncbi:amidohydrolase family protein [uncultured Methanomethylovorans sp.]|uniref:amidohydrolase family protein n=1 Tax=uncultured Methanomethylovorans sp. TaxID=183759 RepID=UPI00262AC854|nr:amidohydrolase family protein [uncultured Methanomethylovorans sp.]